MLRLCFLALACFAALATLHGDCAEIANPCLGKGFSTTGMHGPQHVYSAYPAHARPTGMHSTVDVFGNSL